MCKINQMMTIFALWRILIQCNSDYLGARKNVLISTYMYIKSKKVVNILNVHR